MAIRITGLNSGLDTDSIVQELVSAYRTKGEKYEKAQTKITWKQEAWKSLSAKTYSFRTGLDTLRFASGYNLKTTSVSNSSKAKITASNSAVNGTQTLEVKQLAKSGYLTGGKVQKTDGSDVESTSTMAELGMSGTGEIAINGKRVTLSSTMTVSEVTSKLNDAGIKATFDATNQRLFLSASESGKDADFSITALDGDGVAALSGLGLNTDDADTYKNYATKYGKLLESDADTDEHKEADIYYNLANVLQSYPKDATDANGSELDDPRIEILAKEFQAATDYVTQDEIVKEFRNLISYGESLKQEDRYNVYAEKYADCLTSDKEGQAYSEEIYGKLENVLNNLTEADAANEPEIASLSKRYKDAIAGGNTEEEVAALNELWDLISDAQKTAASGSSYRTNSDAVRVEGQDAEICLNGATFTSTSNTFSINGLTIDALATTDPGETVTVTTVTDSQGIYDKIKDFISEYNEIINAMTKAYNADSTSSYEPLTDDEKDAMSESEIEKWEEKGKSGILRRDSTLSTLMSVMTNAMSKSYTINGKSYALSSFGIKTLGILNAETNEHNAYHIDGDSDDESTSSNTDKLMAAIVEDPEAVTEFFKNLASDLYDSLGKQMSSTTLRSYGSFYNDKELESQYKSYTTKISDWEDKIEDIEERYYKQFSKMESALAELNSQQSSLSGLLG